MLGKETASRIDAPATVVLSGRVCSGKTTLATALEVFGFQRVSTRALLLASAPRGADLSRTGLQRLGEQLDLDVGGSWVADAVTRLPSKTRWTVVDAIRTVEQRAAIGRLSRVVHCHLWAPPEVLARRHEFQHREDPDFEPPAYLHVSNSETESRVDSLASVADAVFNTERFTPHQLAMSTAGLLGLV